MQVHHGFIGVTDPDWYGFLSALPRVDEVNFWQPHARTFRAIGRNEPFFFKLKAPHNAIAGFGFFERWERLPAWLAWESFGEMNGAADFESMRDRIIRLRSEPPSRAAMAGSFEIGCIMIAAPVFFPHDAWVRTPADWARSGIQVGKTYDLPMREEGGDWKACPGVSLR
jgi:putative restriction endonuclease